MGAWCSKCGKLTYYNFGKEGCPRCSPKFDYFILKLLSILGVIAIMALIASIFGRQFVW